MQHRINAYIELHSTIAVVRLHRTPTNLVLIYNKYVCVAGQVRNRFMRNTIVPLYEYHNKIEFPWLSETTLFYMHIIMKREILYFAKYSTRSRLTVIHLHNAHNGGIVSFINKA